MYYHKIMSKKVAIIGTNGIPSNYGGFETLVEYLVNYLSDKYDITVYCSGSGDNKPSVYKGAKLEYIALSANNWQSIPFDIVSYFKTYRKYDKIIILGSSGCLALPLFLKYSHKFIFNFGGLDWQRSKWGFFTKKLLKLTESLGIKYSKFIIADNIGIQEYIKKEYNKDSILITYGGDQAVKIAPTGSDINKYPFLITSYAFTVARIQPDNNIELMLEAFDENSTYPFVFVGNWNKSDYGIKVKEKFLNKPNLILLDAIYDQRELNVLRSNCKVYFHGHSAGGTNPALVEAMNLGLPVLAFANVFNKYTTNFEAEYFFTTKDIKEKLKQLSDDDLKIIGNNMLNIAKQQYQWKDIAEQYAEVIESE